MSPGETGNSNPGSANATAERARALFNRARAWGKQKPLIPLVVGGAIVVAIFVALLLWAGGPDYRVLYSNLSDADGGKIIAALDQRAVPYKFAQGGHALLVPADKVYDTRLQLAAQGLPQAGDVGLKIMDNEPFGISQFAEQVNYQRGLQGELANTIEVLRPVASAKVNLALPKDSLFVRDRQPAKATVVLTLQPGRALSDSQVQAIVHMVSSSVRDLSEDNVTVVDQDGHLLTRDGTTMDLDGAQLNYVHTLEQGYQQRILNILKPIVGSDNVHAQVTAQVDFSHREETDEHYGPNQGDNPAAVRSSQTHVTRSGNGRLPGGVPGALANTPPGSAASPINNPQTNGKTPATNAGRTAARNTSVAQQGDAEQETTTNYELDHNIVHIQHHLGDVQRLSVAVVVNYRSVKQKDGSFKAVALDDNTMKEITNLAREAVGYSAARGDTVAVVNTAFSPSGSNAGATSWWRQLDWATLLAKLGRYLLVAIVLFFLYRLVLRPLRKHYLATGDDKGDAAKPADAAAGDAGDNAAAEPQTTSARPKRPSASYEQSLNGLKDMAKKDPDMVAMIVRGWMRHSEQ